MEPGTTDVAVFTAVVLARFALPLLIPRYPLPAILACLVLDGVDQTVFQLFTDLDLDWYQGYDKALDIFYLTIAMLSTARNWTNRAAWEVARFLFYVRLAGVTAFELTEWRPLLLLFPNTFEYFFIFYEVVRSRWSPDRMSRRLLVVVAAAIWVFVKLPQEYWIHIAQLDVTDTVRALPGLAVAVALVAAVGVVVGVRLVRRHAPPVDHAIILAADPLPLEIDEAHERARFVAERWRVLGPHLAEKIVLVALVTVIFEEVVPGVRATPLQTVWGVAVIITVNAFLTLQLARAGRSVESVFTSFAALAFANVSMVYVYDLVLQQERGGLDEATVTFFLLLLTLIVTLYDRWRPVAEWRFGALPVRA